jgi:hypothetical protein
VSRHDPGTFTCSILAIRGVTRHLRDLAAYLDNLIPVDDATTPLTDALFRGSFREGFAERDRKNKKA